MSGAILGFPAQPSIGFLGRSLLSLLAVLGLLAHRRLPGLRQRLCFLMHLPAAHRGRCPAHHVRFLLDLHQAHHRYVAARLVHIAAGCTASALFNEAHAFPDEDRSAKAVVSGNSPTYRDVVEPGGLGGFVFGSRAPGGRYLGEAVFLIPYELLAAQFSCFSRFTPTANSQRTLIISHLCKLQKELTDDIPMR